GVQAGEWFTEQLVGLGHDTETLGKKLNRHTKRMERLANKSGKAKQKRANKSAKDTNKSAIYIEKRLALLDAIVDDIYRNTRGLISIADLNTGEETLAAQTLRDTLKESREATSGALASTSQYRDTVRDIEAQNLSRTIRI